MRRARRLANQAGFSLIEVMVGATIFIIGFSILVGSVDRTLRGLPVREDRVAVLLTESAISQIWAGDTTSIDSVVTFLGSDCRLQRIVSVDSTVVRCEVIISKPRSGKELMRTAYEMLAPAK